MIYNLRRKVRRWWQVFMQEFDESGFGEPVREFKGRLVSELTGKTGERGKGVNFMQVFYVCMIVVLTLRAGWTLGWLIVFIIAALAVFPSLRRLLSKPFRRWLHRFEAPDEVFWAAESPLPTLKPGEARHRQRPIEVGAERARPLITAFVHQLIRWWGRLRALRH